jgi:hypothetical protein
VAQSRLAARLDERLLLQEQRTFSGNAATSALTRFDPLAECRIASVARVVRSRQHAVSRSTLVNGESKKTGAAHG